MRILLTANASYAPPRGGATRSNLVWLERLAAAGHECRIVAATLAGETGVRTERLGSIHLTAVAAPAERTRTLTHEIREFQPDWTLVSSEDAGHVLLREALRSAPGRVVYLAHTPQFFPFGPASWNPEPDGPELIARCAGVVAIGEYMAGYVERHTGRRPEIVHPPIYGAGPFRQCGSFDAGLVTMINPCEAKGAGLFLELARRLPNVAFGALPGWGTTAADLRALKALPNVTLLAACRDIEEMLARTRILLAPSLWAEGFGLIVMEARLRGVPVVASNTGGLPEAMRGSRFVIPVRPIERVEPVFDESGMPRLVAPGQDVEPWVRAVESLLSDRALYESESESARRHALGFVAALRPERMEEYLAGLARRRPLRVLLAHNSLYYPAHGGGDISNRLLMEALAARGHVCRVVARLGAFGERERQRYLADLAARETPVDSSEGGVVVFRRRGVEVHVAAAREDLRAYFSAQTAAFAPDVILSSTDDPAQLLLEPALGHPTARVVYLARATLALPFGPDCAFPSEAKAAALRQADGVVGVSEYVAGYIRRHSGIEAAAPPISLLEPGPWPELGRIENEFVTMVNPCQVKGLPILLALAGRMPDVRFAAVPTWGATREDRAALARHANITVLDPVDDIDEIFRRTRVLLVPSLWAEARSRIVVEAQLRGVPTLASDIGGIPEAKLGVPYLLPVQPIVKYRPVVDEQMAPVPETPEQDAGPWAEALTRLLTDPAHYQEIARASRAAALAYAERLSVEPFERFLEQVVAAPRRPRIAAAAAPPTPLDALSPERRRLLALRLARKAWFPHAPAEGVAALRLFAFPHAGGGATAFRAWKLPRGIALLATRLPGRENRISEPPFDRMAPLIEALGRAIEPHLVAPFAFYGHSMGAAVAFELARWLRRRGMPAPAALFVSGARAPHFRRNYAPPPDPADAQLLAELRRLEGAPPEALADPGLMRLVLPALRADSALYRHYVYAEEPPLDCAIHAYGGLDDPNITPERLEAWREETTRAFTLRMLPGGHFFVRSNAFLPALLEDLCGPGLLAR
jgi:surfactin synthase thioesterase subunit/glycosyltransferase involved in cell wall biosynthesis